MAGHPPPTGGEVGPFPGSSAISSGNRAPSVPLTLSPPASSRPAWTPDQLALMGLTSSSEPPAMAQRQASSVAARQSSLSAGARLQTDTSRLHRASSWPYSLSATGRTSFPAELATASLQGRPLLGARATAETDGQLSTVTQAAGHVTNGSFRQDAKQHTGFQSGGVDLANDRHVETPKATKELPALPRNLALEHMEAGIINEI